MTAYTKQHELVKCVERIFESAVADRFTLFVNSAFYRWMLSAPAPNGWMLPILYTVTRDLKRIATLVSTSASATRASRLTS